MIKINQILTLITAYQKMDRISTLILVSEEIRQTFDPISMSKFGRKVVDLYHIFLNLIATAHGFMVVFS